MSTNKNLLHRLLALAGSAALLTSCIGPAPLTGPIPHEHFGITPDGQSVEIYTLSNRNGVEARIMTYGGILLSLKVPDRNGKMGDVVLGYDDLDSYVKNNPFFGAMVGRYGNRIAKGRFSLDGIKYKLATNNYPNALHGGIKGFDKRVWNATAQEGQDGPELVLTYLSKDGEEGYPGNLMVTATYTLMRDNALRLEYEAQTDKDTVLNLTEHSYFNLAGKGNILNHKVQIPADRITAVDATLIPTGELRPVENTPFDFRTPTAIGARIGQDDEQLKFGGGYDHNWIINKELGKLSLMARVTEPESGRVLELFSTEPGLQFYTGNFLDGSITGKGGWVYQRRSAFCMEPQHFPDSPNHVDFPSTELKPGQVYHHTIIYRFAVQP
ncbi:MAG TPA: aldose epimerase family protein [Candidatus Cybelea sp.]|jgi:aldose 1-epimerase|nr:aldose epimerase family protein [Candidatus Cybelea sp.]